MRTIETWQQRVKQLKQETYAIYLAAKDPRVSWYAKLLIAFVVAHTFSPIDLGVSRKINLPKSACFPRKHLCFWEVYFSGVTLIPDFIPVLGYVDDLIIAPLGIWLALKMIPAEVMTESREKAQAQLGQDRPRSWVAAAVIIGIWLLVAVIGAVLVLRVIRG